MGFIFLEKRIILAGLKREDERKGKTASRETSEKTIAFFWA